MGVTMCEGGQQTMECMHVCFVCMHACVCVHSFCVRVHECCILGAGSNYFCTPTAHLACFRDARCKPPRSASSRCSTR